MLIADIGRFQETMLNEGRGQDNNGQEDQRPKGEPNIGARKSAQLEGTTKPIAETFTGNDVHGLGH